MLMVMTMIVMMMIMMMIMMAMTMIWLIMVMIWVDSWNVLNWHSFDQPRHDDVDGNGMKFAEEIAKFSCSFFPILDKTQNRLMVALYSKKGPNLKVVKWCWKRWNGPILLHIYDRQCEIIQKIQWKSSNFQFQCFSKGTSGALCCKRRKTPKLGKLKHPLLNFFK